MRVVGVNPGETFTKYWSPGGEGFFKSELHNKQSFWEELRGIAEDYDVVGLAVPGLIVKEKKDERISAYKYPVLNQITKKRIEGMLNKPVKLLNDTDAESYHYAKLLNGSVFVISLGSGPGSGYTWKIKEKFEIFTGKDSRGPEIGHIPLGNGGIQCPCGGYDHAKNYLSLHYLIERSGVKSRKEFVEQAKILGSEAYNEVKGFGEAVARLVTIVSRLFHPDYIVLTGGTMEMLKGLEAFKVGYEPYLEGEENSLLGLSPVKFEFDRYAAPKGIYEYIIDKQEEGPERDLNPP